MAYQPLKVFVCIQIGLFIYTMGNDKIVVLKKTTQQLYFKTSIEKKSIQVTWLCSRADIYSMKPPSALVTASIRIRNREHAFSTSADKNPVNTRRMAVVRLAFVLWDVMLVMFSTYDQTKKSSGFRSGEEEGQWVKGTKS